MFLQRFIVVAIIGFSGSAWADEPTTGPATRASDRRDIPNYGVSVYAPPNWGVGAGTDGKMAVAYIRATPTLQGLEVTAGISVAIEVVQVPAGGVADLRSTARLFAEKYKGIVVDEKLTLGGEPAVQIKFSPPRQLGFVQHILAIQNNLVYFVSLSLSPGEPTPPEWIEFVEKFRWIPIERPAANVRLDGAATRTLRGAVEINLPLNSITIPPTDTAAAADYLVYNVKDNRAEFVIYLRMKDRPANVADAQLRQLMASNIKQMYPTSLRQAAVLRPHSERPGIAWTSFFEVRDETQNFREKWGIIPAGPDRVLHVGFRIHGTVERDDVPYYERLAEQIAETIRSRDPSN